MTSTISNNPFHPNKPCALHLTVSVADRTYILGTLSFNPIKEECSYHFDYPFDSSKHHYTRGLGEGRERNDHVTWHREVVHIKRGNGAAIEQKTYSSGPLFSSKPIITPIYLESHYFTSNMPYLIEASHFKTWKGSHSQEVLSLKQSDGFSIVFILMPMHIDTPSILLGTQLIEIPKNLDFPPYLGQLCDANHQPGRIQLWEGWDLLVVTSPLKYRIFPPIPPILGIENSYRIGNYQNVSAALTDLLMQANNLTKKGI